MNKIKEPSFNKIPQIPIEICWKYLSRLSKALVENGFKKKETLLLMKFYARKRCSESINRNQLRGLCFSSFNRIKPKTYARFRKLLNSRHAIVWINGSCYILTEKFDAKEGWKTIELSTEKDLKLLYANVRDGKESTGQEWVKTWIKDPQRREYDGIVFLPRQQTNGYYNLWQGFSMVPKKGDCSLFLRHIRENIARRDKAVYRYVLSWLANVMQNPINRPGVALVLIGKQGVGKGIFVSQFGRLLDPHFLHIQHTYHLTGHFNSHFYNALLVFADEAFLGSNKNKLGPLKALITEDKLPIEFKGKDLIFIKNYVHLILASNNAAVLPKDCDERRFFRIEVGDEHKEDHRYFHAIVNQMENGGREALLHFLLHYEIDWPNLRKFPKSRDSLKVKLAQLSESESFWLRKLLLGSLVNSDDNWQRSISKKKLYREFAKFNNYMDFSSKSLQTSLGMSLKILAPGLRTKKHLRKGKSVAIWKFPSLIRCRHDFEKTTGLEIDWDDASSISLIEKGKV